MWTRVWKAVWSAVSEPAQEGRHSTICWWIRTAQRRVVKNMNLCKQFDMNWRGMTQQNIKQMCLIYIYIHLLSTAVDQEVISVLAVGPLSEWNMLALIQHVWLWKRTSPFLANYRIDCSSFGGKYITVCIDKRAIILQFVSQQGEQHPDVTKSIQHLT